MKTIKFLPLLALAAILVSSCGSTADILATPVENIDTLPLKVSELTETEKQKWGHLDLVRDTIPGMSVDKAYSEIIKNKKGKTVIVAVIDSGIDIDHEDLDDVIWTNTDEVPNNGKDDDNNGYVDDVHGWNFVGDGYNEQLEYVRIIASGDTSNPRFQEAKAELETERQKYLELKTNYDQFLLQLSSADETISKHLGKKDYTKAEVNAIKTEDKGLQQSKSIIQYVYSLDAGSVSEFKQQLKDGVEQFNDRLNYYLNVNHKGRLTGDNPDDYNDRPYGDGNVKPKKKDESHGTHVAGIIAAERKNNKGVKGVANNVKIMSIRSTPRGDEYDKDVALAIRYAVDNGAKIINASFGKSYSPHSDWVRDAIKYASDKDVLFVHAAGNDSNNIDVKPNFPDDNVNGVEISNTYIRVGALAPKYGTNMVANFSNYGKQNVDVFAPGGEIYSTMPENEYEFQGGTSMAAPAVAGVAALIRSYYPSLSAAQVKKILMDSGLEVKTKVIVGGDTSNIKPFSELTRSGKMVNAYNALVMAQKLSK
ncbi:S8 family peptidase [uncultured Algibacter sp.]|uniref:S8 family peptidase n=1 Tax=uncultured Algibacter sp. TaxID=298659 RepID=UPI002608A4EB|nr:S8 family peptidase [uncultured Algibacter sp.]